MLGGAMIIWLASTSAPLLEEGVEIPAGVYPASVLIEACELIDERPTMIANDEVGNYAVLLRVPLRVSRETLESMHIALRTAGVYRINYMDRDGNPFAYATTDPRVPPRKPRNYDIRVIPIRHADPVLVADFLNQKARELEKNLESESDRTHFVPYKRTGYVLVRYSSPQRLARLQEMLLEIDAAPEKEPLPVLRRYLPRFRRAIDLVEDFEARWEKEADEESEPVRVVSARSQNIVLVRLAESLWPQVEQILQELDQLEE